VLLRIDREQGFKQQSRHKESLPANKFNFARQGDSALTAYNLNITKTLQTMNEPALAPPTSNQSLFSRAWKRFKTWMFLSCICGLGSLNIATLTTDSIHTSSFEGLRETLGYIVTDTFADKLLNNSPTTNRKVDVAKKTTHLTAENHQLRNTVSSLENSTSKIIADQSDISNRYQKLAIEHDELKANHYKLATDHTELNTKHNRLTTDHHDQIAKYQKLATDHAELNTKHSKLSFDHNDLNVKHTKTIQIQEAQATTAKKVASKIAPRVMHTATRAASSLPAKVAPLAGTAVTIGMTAWDIKDMCETLKDLNELNSAFGHPAINKDTVCGIKIPGT
jgi:DNA repair exonuclease SbcCD ATPase subunit